LVLTGEKQLLINTEMNTDHTDRTDLHGSKSAF
jgi:hypothetical protein